MDIGGRGDALQALLPVARCAHYYVFEPDEPEAARLQLDLRREAPWQEVTVMAEAVGSQRGMATLFQTDNPGMSSLLEPDPEVVRRFWNARKFRVVSVEQVPVVPLDEVAEKHGFMDATFLKLDTQGTELDILSSSPRLLDSIVAIYTEACFRPFYKGQGLFADLDSDLRRRGFVLFSLDRTMLRRSNSRKKMYSKRAVAWAHCLYVREPDTLRDVDRTVLQRQLAGLMAMSLGFHHYDFAVEVAAALGRAQLLEAEDVSRLIAEVEQCAARGMRHIATIQAEPRRRQGLTGRSFRDKTRAE